ncbi:hypothetical protein B0T25DRAFT_47598 [Lasiosphaeria hispida]|uniref:Neurofilament medium polypeptide protein n=1 Tax=Lasiosphaeria hispida TaxID=260671 RepID=A0AAJ0HVX0_9PEZI|nr:hypothetical protein B0T25DRAFT_47598 [Lasiosphaeria hispida]
MKCGALIRLVVVGLIGGRGTLGVASPLASSGDGDAIRAGENFRMGLLVPRQAAVAATATNLQAFGGSLGGVKASAITNSGDSQRPFGVDGDTFPDFKTAAIRACDNQFNTCADIANNKTGTFSVGDCDKQTVACKSFADTAPTQAFEATPAALFSSNAEFDFFCE